MKKSALILIVSGGLSTERQFCGGRNRRNAFFVVHYGFDTKEDGRGPSLFCRNNTNGRSNDVDFSALEPDCAVRGCEEREVLAHSDVGAGKKFRSALPDDYRAGFHGLTAEQLYASVFRIAVSAVPR
jgi:hypothetical protein